MWPLVSIASWGVELQSISDSNRPDLLPDTRTEMCQGQRPWADQQFYLRLLAVWFSRATTAFLLKGSVVLTQWEVYLGPGWQSDGLFFQNHHDHEFILECSGLKRSHDMFERVWKFITYVTPSLPVPTTNLYTWLKTCKLCLPYCGRLLGQHTCHQAIVSSLHASNNKFFLNVAGLTTIH